MHAAIQIMGFSGMSWWIVDETPIKRVNQILSRGGTARAVAGPSRLPTCGRRGPKRARSHQEEDGFMRIRTFAALLAIVLVAWPVAAQEQRGSIEGVVKDTSGAVLPGVTVEAKSAGGGVLSAVSDASGNYRFPSLLPGIYEVTANLSGFKPAKVAEIEIKLGSIKKVDFGMQLAGVTEAVTVTAESPIVD